MSGPRNGIIPQTGACGELRAVRAGQEPRLGTSPRTGTDELRPAPQSRTTPDPCRRKNARGRTSAAAPSRRPHASAPVSSAARAGSDRRHCRPLPVRKPLGPAGTSNRDMFGPRPALFGFRPSEVGRQKRCGQRRERQKKKSCGHTLPGRRCDTEPSDSRHGKNAGSQYALFASRTVSSEAVQSPNRTTRGCRPSFFAGESPRKFSGEISGENERDLFVRRTPGRTHHGHITERERTKAGDSGTAAGQRQDNSGKTAERRQRDDRTAAEKQRNGGRETTGRRRRNSRDTTGQRQDSSRETAERRQRNDRTAAQKQQGHGGETTGQQRRNSGTAAGKRQDAGGKTAGTRRGNDRTPAEKQQGHGGETTGQRRKNSRDTAGKRQDSSGKTAGTRRGNDRTAAEKQRSGGGTTAALTDEKRRGPFDSGPLPRRRPAEGDRPHPRSRGAAGRQFTKVSPSLSVSMRIGFSRFTSPARIRFERSLTMYRWIVRFTGRAP